MGAYFYGSAGCWFDDLVLGAVSGNNNVTGTIGSEGGYLILGEAILQVMPGSVDSPVSLKLEKLANAPASLPDNRSSVGAYRVLANQADLKNPLLLIFPVQPTTDTSVITELYGWDGQSYEKLQIGKTNPHFAQYISLSPANGDGSYSAGLTLVAGRASSTDLTSACAAREGNFNGFYCEEPFTAVGQPNWQSQGYVFQCR